MLKYLLSILLSVFFLGCSAPSPKFSENPEHLAALLQTLSPNVPHKEAEALAYAIFQRIAVLREVYKPLSEPHLNNFLINVGVKKQGLCYQWSDALYTHFKKRDYPHFTFHLLVSDRGKYFSEHNVMVVVAKGGEVMDGVIVDPWRKPGKVYVSKVKEDFSYVWEHRAERGCRY